MEKQELQNLVDTVVNRVFVEIEASGRHVHLTAQQAKILFGHPLTPERPLSQPGQYLAKERVDLIGPKGTFRNVAVLGPERKEGQVEISLTDGRPCASDPGGCCLVRGRKRSKCTPSDLYRPANGVW